MRFFFFIVEMGWEKFKICCDFHFLFYITKIKSLENRNEKRLVFSYSETGCCHFQGNSASLAYQCSAQAKITLET